MPEFRLSPAVFPAGIPTAAELEISSNDTTCRHVAFEVWLPPGLRATGLSPQHQVPQIAPGLPVRLPFRLTAATAGEWTFEIRNLCFRDGGWNAINRPNLPVRFRAEKTGSFRAAPQQLVIESSSADCPVSQPTRWQLHVHNRGSLPVRRVSITLGDSWADGSVRSQEVIADLAPGATAAVILSLQPPSIGPAIVPVSLQWLDTAGTLGEQRVGVPVVFSKAAPDRNPPNENERRPCLLFVAAEPRSGMGESMRNLVGDPGVPNAQPRPRHRLRLDYEFRLVREALWQFGDRFAVEHLPAAGITGLGTALLRLRPAYVHVSCHGTEAGELCLEDDDSGGQILPAGQFAALLQCTAANHRCLFLNGCFTERLAPGLRTAADWLVVSTIELDDALAIRFARTFYEGLAGALEVSMAFKRAEAMAGAPSVYRLISTRRGAASFGAACGPKG